MAINFEYYKQTGLKASKPNKGVVVSDATVTEIMDRIKNGAGVRAMAREYDIPKSTISNWVNGHQRTDITGGSLYDQV